jgi:UPF0271 protein
MQIDLNADAGESYGTWSMGSDETLYPLLSSANLACGFHAGDPVTIDTSVALAAKHDVAVGAHPSFPDLVGFGRRPMALTPHQVRCDVAYQIGALDVFLRLHDLVLHHVKPHGALAWAMGSDMNVARAVAETVGSYRSDLPLVALAGPGGDAIRAAAEGTGVEVVPEGFPDRAYLPDGNLAPRRDEGSLVTDPTTVAQRAVRMAVRGEIEARDGTVFVAEVRTLCIHGDNPRAVDIATAVRAALAEAGVTVAPF